LTYSGQVVGYSPAFNLKTSLGLTNPGSNFYFNTRGQGEKYLTGTGSQWYYLLSTGGLYQFNGSLAASTLLATLDPSYYANPSLLVNATAPPSPPVALSMSGNQLTVTSSTTYIGTYKVVANVSDGFTTTSQSFLVSVTGRDAGAGDTSRSSAYPTQSQITVPLSATQADGDPITFSAQAVGLQPGLLLENQFEFDKSRQQFLFQYARPGREIF